MVPPTLGAALLCNSGAGSDKWLYPELITLSIAHREGVTAKGVLMAHSLFAIPCRDLNPGLPDHGQMSEN